MARERRLIALALVLAGLLVGSGIAPHDRATWFMETLPVMIALIVLAYTRRRFPLTPLLYYLIFVHAIVLIGGGAYTYARVPLGDWLQHLLDTERNPYDKIGHFMQGFVPALVAREILLRGDYVRGRRMAAFLAGCVALAVSAVYELIEWWAAVTLGQGAEDFLGTQGDIWDAQSDMMFALIGASVALTFLARVQDRQIDRLRASRPSRTAPRRRRRAESGAAL